MAVSADRVHGHDQKGAGWERIASKEEEPDLEGDDRQYPDDYEETFGAINALIVRSRGVAKAAVPRPLSFPAGSPRPGRSSGP